MGPMGSRGKLNRSNTAPIKRKPPSYTFSVFVADDEKGEKCIIGDMMLTEDLMKQDKLKDVRQVFEQEDGLLVVGGTLSIVDGEMCSRIGRNHFSIVDKDIPKKRRAGDDIVNRIYAVNGRFFTTQEAAEAYVVAPRIPMRDGGASLREVRSVTTYERDAQNGGRTFVLLPNDGSA